MYGKKFYEDYIGPCGLDDVRVIELNRITSKLYFGFDYPQPKTGFYLSHFDGSGSSVFRFVLVVGEIEYNTAGGVESIEYAYCNSSGDGLEFNRFYFNNPYGDRIYLFDR